MRRMMVRSLVFDFPKYPESLDWLLREFRLIANRSIRIALRTGVTSRYRLCKVAYAPLSREHSILKQYIPSAFEVATGALKAYRRRLRKGREGRVPYLRRPMLKAENQSYRLDRTTGRLRISIRAGEHVFLDLPLSSWHRNFLSEFSWALGSLTIVPGRVIITVRKLSPEPYRPEGAIALDTNEDSLDGVVADPTNAQMLRVPLGGIRRVQHTHFCRRRKLARKKANDRRVKRILLARESRRERNRVKQRLHLVSRHLVDAARNLKHGIVLEDLRLPRPGTPSRKLNRRLSSWPYSELHRQIEYKAAFEGVPLSKVPPRYTSKTCPACGARRRDRVGKVFECPSPACGWRLDRQLNAGLNILKTALASNEALARAVWFQPAALRKDVMIPLCELLAATAGAREEPSGDESRAPLLIE